MAEPDPWGIPGARDALLAAASPPPVAEDECADCGAFCTGDVCECPDDCPGVQLVGWRAEGRYL